MVTDKATRALHEERGFSLAELATAIVIMALLIGIGVWVMIGSRYSNAVQSAKLQVSSDLQLCSLMAQASKKPWGIRLYNIMESDGALRNSYRWFYCDNLSDNYETNPPTEVSPPKGATENASGDPLKVIPPGEARIVRTPRPSPDYDPGATYLDIRFKPSGSVMVCQYSIGNAGSRQWKAFGSGTYIRFSDKSGYNQKDLTVYPLGDISR